MTDNPFVWWPGGEQGCPEEGQPSWGGGAATLKVRALGHDTSQQPYGELILFRLSRVKQAAATLDAAGHAGPVVPGMRILAFPCGLRFTRSTQHACDPPLPRRARRRQRVRGRASRRGVGGGGGSALGVYFMKRVVGK